MLLWVSFVAMPAGHIADVRAGSRGQEALQTSEQHTPAAGIGHLTGLADALAAITAAESTVVPAPLSMTFMLVVCVNSSMLSVAQHLNCMCHLL